MEYLLNILEAIRMFLESVYIPFGKERMSLWSLTHVIFLLVVLVYGSGVLKRWIVKFVVARGTTNVGVQQALGSIVRYVVVLLGLMIIVETAGVNLSSLTIIAGALGVGIGFGLQNITNNFVSGLVILFERPIKVGDRIQVGEITGDVIRISPRATTVSTNDNITIIIPNSEFISSRVINWSHADRDVRLHVQVGVSYNSDPERVRELLLEVAAGEEGVLKSPKPDVIFEGFGDSSLNFVLRVWTSEFITRPPVLRSRINFAIMKKFKENGVEIPYPQRDVHIKTNVDGA